MMTPPCGRSRRRCAARLRSSPRSEGKKRAQDAQNRVVAQGAGDIARTHRCPGEPATIALLDVAVKKIANADWLVPDQDLRVDLRRLPATPGARGMLVKVRN